MSARADWEQIKRLGGGGQSDVFLVRSPERKNERTNALVMLGRSISPTSSVERQAEHVIDLADSIAIYVRPDLPSELGAMKVFKLRDDSPAGEQQALNRMQQEIRVLQENRAGLPKLLDFNEKERWIVTEFFPEGTLEDHILSYKGKPVLALKAFQSLVRTVAALHTENIVHRDIKPANVFVKSLDELILGDFGIVFLPNQPFRLTRTDESVGPHSYMPPWGEVGGRLDAVHPNFDVYMLGKLLWCMVSGRMLLQREWYTAPENDVTQMFRHDPHAWMINIILDKCLVDREEKCRTSAQDLLATVNAFLGIIGESGQLLNAGVPRPCHVCGYGEYKPLALGTQPSSNLGLRFWLSGADTSTMNVSPYVCDACGHVELFKK